MFLRARVQCPLDLFSLFGLFIGAEFGAKEWLQTHSDKRRKDGLFPAQTDCCLWSTPKSTSTVNGQNSFVTRVTSTANRPIEQSQGKSRTGEA